MNDMPDVDCNEIEVFATNSLGLNGTWGFHTEAVSATGKKKGALYIKKSLMDDLVKAVRFAEKEFNRQGSVDGSGHKDLARRVLHLAGLKAITGDKK